MTTGDGLRAEDLASLLDLELVEQRTDRSTFLGRVRRSDMEWPLLYGGQVAAQALVAAGATLPDDRRPHSLHAYFLRSGRTDRKVEFHVDHDRDGRRFSARHVRAVQDDRVIFSMITSFTTVDAVSVLDEVPNRIERRRDPDECADFPIDAHVEARQITESRTIGRRRLHPDTMWVRVSEPLESTPLLDAAVLTYLSDLGSGFSQNEDEAVGVGDVSLDHAIWFHQQLDPRSWLVLDMWPMSAVTGRGVYHGCIRDADGRLGVTIVQENLLRPY